MARCELETARELLTEVDDALFEMNNSIPEEETLLFLIDESQRALAKTRAHIVKFFEENNGH